MLKKNETKIAIVGARGMEHTLNVEPSEDETALLRASAEAVRGHSFAQI